MTKAEMQQLIDRQNERIHELEQQITALNAATEDKFRCTALYHAMRAENDALRKINNAYAAREKTNAERIARYKLLKSRTDPIPADKLQEKVVKQEEVIKTQRETINMLRNQMDELMYELHPDEMPQPRPTAETAIPVVGRPKVSSQIEEKTAREYRKEGYSVREISDIMHWSIGKTQQVVETVVVDPKVVKQHRAENRKAAARQKK